MPKPSFKKISLLTALCIEMVLLSLAGCDIASITGLSGCSNAVTIEVQEGISVNEIQDADSGPLITASEDISVSDAVSIIKPLLIYLVENINVSDLSGVYPPVIISLLENVSVSDSATSVTAQEPTVRLLNPPQLISPGAVSLPGETVKSLMPTFQWAGVAGADGYGLYIVDTASKQIIFNSREMQLNISGTTFTLPANILSWGKTYHWYMNSHNSAGWGEYSANLYFQTLPPNQ